jgi:hypothetical protein
MKVYVKELGLDMAVKNRGIELDVYDAAGKKHLGDLVITKTRLIWCRGKTSRENGRPLTWDEFIERMES